MADTVRTVVQKVISGSNAVLATAQANYNTAVAAAIDVAKTATGASTVNPTVNTIVVGAVSLTFDVTNALYIYTSNIQYIIYV